MVLWKYDIKIIYVRLFLTFPVLLQFNSQYLDKYVMLETILPEILLPQCSYHFHM